MNQCPLPKSSNERAEREAQMTHLSGSSQSKARARISSSNSLPSHSHTLERRRIALTLNDWRHKSAHETPPAKPNELTVMTLCSPQTLQFPQFSAFHSRPISRVSRATRPPPARPKTERATRNHRINSKSRRRGLMIRSTSNTTEVPLNQLFTCRRG